MRPISKSNKEIMEADPYYKECCYCGRRDLKIDWHHVWIYEGSQIDEVWAIMPVCAPHHKLLEGCKELREWIMLLSLKRISLEAIYEQYPAKGWRTLKYMLQARYPQKPLLASIEDASIPI